MSAGRCEWVEELAFRPRALFPPAPPLCETTTVPTYHVNAILFDLDGVRSECLQGDANGWKSWHLGQGPSSHPLRRSAKLPPCPLTTSTPSSSISTESDRNVCRAMRMGGRAGI